MASRSGSAATPATVALARSDVAHTVHPYHPDPRASSASYGLEAAAALGVDAGRVLKTLVAEVDGEPTLALVPVSAHLDLKRLAAAVRGKRAVLADRHDAERVTGYVVGGISPLGQRRKLPTVVDTAATGHATVYVSAGRRGLEVELAPEDLVRLTAARVAPLARSR